MTDRAALAEALFAALATFVLTKEKCLDPQPVDEEGHRQVVEVFARVLAEYETAQEQALSSARDRLQELTTHMQATENRIASLCASHEHAHIRAEAAEARCAHLEQERDAMKREAQCQAQEMRTQRAIVREIYQLCSGATGEPGDWHGAEPVRQLVAEHERLRAAREQVRMNWNGLMEAARANRSGEIDSLYQTESYRRLIDAALAPSQEPTT